MAGKKATLSARKPGQRKPKTPKTPKPSPEQQANADAYVNSAAKSKGGRPRKLGGNEVQTTIRLDPELHALARIACFKRHASLSELVSELLRKELGA